MKCCLFELVELVVDVSGESWGPAGYYLQLLPLCPSGPQTLRLPRAVMRGPAFFAESVTCKHGGRKKKDAVLCSQRTAQESWRHSCNSRARSGLVPAAPCPSRGARGSGLALPSLSWRALPLTALGRCLFQGPSICVLCFLFFVFNRNFIVTSVSTRHPVLLPTGALLTAHPPPRTLLLNRL